MHSRSRSRWLGRRSLALVAAVAVLAGCAPLPKPAGAGTIRYRDQVFSAVDRHEQPPVRLGARSERQQPGEPHARPLPARRPTRRRSARRSCGCTAGSFTAGDKTNIVPVDVANTFAKLGYVVVSINYRLTRPARLRGQPLSVRLHPSPRSTPSTTPRRPSAGCAATPTTYGIDSARIGIGGESAGGHHRHPGGPASRRSGHERQSRSVVRRSRAFVSVSGGLPGGVFASSAASPGLFFHGTADRTVSPSVVRGHRRVAADPRAWLVVLQQQDGAGHVPWAQYRSLYLQQSDYFLYFCLDSRTPRASRPLGARAADSSGAQARRRSTRRSRSHALDERDCRSPPRRKRAAGSRISLCIRSAERAQVRLRSWPNPRPSGPSAPPRP